MHCVQRFRSLTAPVGSVLSLYVSLTPSYFLDHHDPCLHHLPLLPGNRTPCLKRALDPAEVALRCDRISQMQVSASCLQV